MLFVTVFTTILLGGLKNFFRSAQDVSIEEFMKNRSLAAAILGPAIGLFIIFSNLYRYYYSNLERDVALYGICFGSCGVLYGSYKWFRIARAKKSNDGGIKNKKKR